MELINATQRYFDAWNEHESDAILATFAAGGTYSDPVTREELIGQAIAKYADSLFEAFPDLFFEIISCTVAGDAVVAVQWLARGTNMGSIVGGPPTWRSIDLPGAAFITFQSNKIQSVRCYFDQITFVQQLALPRFP